MSRELRMVPPDWQHPKRPGTYFDGTPRYVPLHEGPYSVKAAKWDERAAKWEEGMDWCYVTDTYIPKCDRAKQYATLAEWDGERPVQEEYMPEWPEGTATHYMMYETVSEGTPVSPAFATPEELARWLAKNRGNEGTYDQWLKTIQRGSTPGSAVVRDGVIYTGVQAADLE